MEALVEAERVLKIAGPTSGIAGVLWETLQQVLKHVASIEDSVGQVKNGILRCERRIDEVRGKMLRLNEAMEERIEPLEAAVQMAASPIRGFDEFNAPPEAPTIEAPPVSLTSQLSALDDMVKVASQPPRDLPSGRVFADISTNATPVSTLLADLRHCKTQMMVKRSNTVLVEPTPAKPRGRNIPTPKNTSVWPDIPPTPSEFL
eukprot:TRINITY_DN37175_c0_g1_i1.p1 TRINITY_DN37175_c0_g1~~TRINITY_DN37175_c0_g1_i1.p1  ORF type:complete len:204 (+),score=26.41 TRINITY_DN37175_c0_g1_i1:54-665(+)